MAKPPAQTPLELMLFNNEAGGASAREAREGTGRSAEDQRAASEAGRTHERRGRVAASLSPSRRVRTDRRGLKLGRSPHRVKLGAVGGLRIEFCPDTGIFGL